jgi:hypothetical protein
MMRAERFLRDKICDGVDVKDENGNTNTNHTAIASIMEDYANTLFEEEVQGRLAFKKEELLKGLMNTVETKWVTAFFFGSQRETYYWEAYKQIIPIIEKEFDMLSTYDNMGDIKRREARDKAIEAIAERFKIHGSHNGQAALSFLANEIEKAQTYLRL